MSVALPPLPPRRNAPPPPPRRAVSGSSETVRDDPRAPPFRRTSTPITSSKISEEELPTGGIAARIAGLQLDQITRTKTSLAKPPPIPRPRKDEVRYPEPEPEPEPEPAAVASDDEDRPYGNESGEFEGQLNTSPRGPPPTPPKWTRPSPAELARALARRPPPPPIQTPTPPPPPRRRYLEPESESSPPRSPREAGPPRRGLPPMPTQMPAPPLDPISEPEEETGYLESAEEEEEGSCLQCHDFSHVDAHAAQFPRHTVVSLDNLAYDLTEPFEYETEKARAIFTWMHHNIAYDAVSFLSGNIQASTPEGTFRSGLAVCDGYSGLYKALAERVGMQVHRVTGHGKGFGYAPTAPGDPVPRYSSGHAWNCVYMDGEWRLIDACWGAGVLNGSVYQQRFAPVWFNSGPAEFGKRHFPEDESYQLMAESDGGPVSWEDYIMEQEGPVIFGDFYELNLWSGALRPETKYLESGQTVTFSLFKRCEHLSTAEEDNFVYIISLPDNTRIPLELNAEGGWSADVYIPRGVGEVSLYSVTIMDGRDAMGIGIRAFKQALGRKGMSFGGLARWTII